jgi:predicted alpha/beta superfamily hydrolase
MREKTLFILNNFAQGGKIIMKMKNSRCFLLQIKPILYILFTFTVYSNLIAQDTNKQGQSYTTVKLDGTRQYNFTSSVTNQEYCLHISLPRSYNESAKTFPVIYLLDSQWDFPFVYSIYGQLYYDGFLPGIIIVGITWGGKDPDYDKRRAFDLTPTIGAAGIGYGNAPNFLKCIKKELIPFVESNFKAKKDDRTLMGSSFGGLFTLYALFHETGLFNNYVLTSPATGWDNDITFQYENKFSETHKRLPVRLYMAMGGLEDIRRFKKITDIIISRNYKDLKFDSRIIDNCGHSGSKAEGYTRGLQYVFQKPSIKVNPSILDKYCGEYLINPGFKIKFIRQDSTLVALTPNDEMIPISAETDKDFYFKGQYLSIHFKPDNNGNISGFMQERWEGNSFIKKVK